MKRSILRAPLFLIALTAIAVFVDGQPATEGAEVPGLVLKVQFFEGREPDHLTIFKKGRSAAWFGLFKKMGSDRTGPPVRAVNIDPRWDGPGARVRVSVFTGEKFHENKEFVSEVSVIEGAETTVEELRKFGVAPFKLSLVRVTPSTANLPALINKTQSLIVALEPVFETLPAVKVRLFNSAAKGVKAIAIETALGDRILLSSQPRGRNGMDLIPPGKQYAIRFHVGIPERLKGSKEAEREVSFVIAAVIFEDGTYEGDAARAARYFVGRVGEKIQLTENISRLEALLKEKSTEINLVELADQMYSKEPTIPNSELKKLHFLFAELPQDEVARFRRRAEIGAFLVRRQTYAYLRERASGTTDPRQVIESLLEEQSGWLSRLPE